MHKSCHVGQSRISLPDGRSEAIRIARVICILSMVSVHFWPGASRILAVDVWLPVHGFYLLAIDYMGRGSVPLLSTISGVLLTLSFFRNVSPSHLLMSKARSLLIPMIIWSAILMALYGLWGLLSGNPSRLPSDFMDWTNSLIALGAPPANAPLGFLRDLFISSVF